MDPGGKGVAYYDIPEGNAGSANRDIDLDTEESNVDSNDDNRAWVRNGEWWTYTVDVPADGEYSLIARLAGKNTTTLDVSVDDSLR